MGKSTKKEIKTVILVAQGVQDQEFWYPYYRLKEAELDVKVVASLKDNLEVKSHTITGKYGIPIQFDYTTKTLHCQSFDLIIIPGGWQAPEIMRQDVYIFDYLYSQRKKSIIGTICHGPQVLISADIVKGRRMTCYKGMKDDLINAGASYVDLPVVVDKNIITSPHYDNNPEFMKAILEQINV